MDEESPERALVERALVERARSGDRHAFEQLVGIYSDRVRRVAARRLSARLRERVGLDDVVQETFLRGFEGIGSFRWVDGTKDCFLAWLLKILHNVICTAASEQKRRGLSALVEDVDAGGPSASGVLRRHERFDRLRDALRRLKPDQRAVIQLVRIEGRAIRDAATILDKTPNAVSILLSRATKRLRELFGDTDSFGLPDRSLSPRDDENVEDGDGDRD